jgi:hypothetical protein
MKFMFKRIILLMVLALIAVPMWAQVETGSISGTVRDTTGASVAGATVTARSVSTSAQRSATSGDNGQYNITGLAPGVYELTVNATGFAQYTSRLEVTVGGVVTVDPQLSVGNQTTTIEVVAAGGVEVNTQNQELSQVVNTLQMEQLPSLTRNPYDFVQISGNVSSGDRTASGMDQNTTNRGGWCGHQWATDVRDRSAAGWRRECGFVWGGNWRASPAGLGARVPGSHQ